MFSEPATLSHRHREVNNSERCRWALRICALLVVLFAGSSASAEPLVFFSEREEPNEPDSLELVRQNLEGNDRTRMVEWGYVSPYFVTQDGKTLVFNYEDLIFSQPSDGENSNWDLISPSDYAYMRPYVSLSPDGQRIVYMFEAPNSAEFGVFSSAVDGQSDAVRLSSAAPLGNASTLTAGVFTPDGTRVVFQESDGNVVRLYSRAADGSDEAPVLLSNVGPLFGDVLNQSNSIAFSPDSSRVAYLIEEGALRRIYSAALDGTGDPLLISNDTPAEGTTVGEFFYGSNSEYVVFEETSGAYRQIFSKRDLANWPLRTLLSNPSPEESAEFIDGNPVPRDSASVLFIDTADEIPGVFRAELNASAEDEAVLLSDLSSVRSAALSADGKTVIYTSLGYWTEVYAAAVEEPEEESVLISDSFGMNMDSTILPEASGPLGLQRGTHAISPDQNTVIFLGRDLDGIVRFYSRPLDGTGSPALVSTPGGEHESAHDAGSDLQWDSASRFVVFTQNISQAGDSPVLQAWSSRGDGSQAPVLLSREEPTAGVFDLLLVPEPGIPFATLAAIGSLLAVRRTRKHQIGVGLGKLQRKFVTGEAVSGGAVEMDRAPCEPLKNLGSIEDCSHLK